MFTVSVKEKRQNLKKSSPKVSPNTKVPKLFCFKVLKLSLFWHKERKEKKKNSTCPANPINDKMYIVQLQTPQWLKNLTTHAFFSVHLLKELREEGNTTSVFPTYHWEFSWRSYKKDFALLSIAFLGTWIGIMEVKKELVFLFWNFVLQHCRKWWKQNSFEGVESDPL